MFEEIENINTRPEPFECYTASDLWTDEHTSKQMLTFHLTEDIDVSSRNAEFINRSVQWIASRFNVGAGTKIADFGCGPGFYATRLAHHSIRKPRKSRLPPRGHRIVKNTEQSHAHGREFPGIRTS